MKLKPEEEGKEKDKLDKFFDTKKLFIRVGLIVLGVGVVFYMFRKMKKEYVN